MEVIKRSFKKSTFIYGVGLMLATLLLTVSCGTNETTKKVQKEKPKPTTPEIVVDKNDPGYKLLSVNCYACHGPLSPSHEAIIAPPMVGIKMHYKEATQSREEFIKVMTAYIQEPSKDKSLLNTPEGRFGIMPQTFLSESDVQTLVAYIYDNELEKPKWFDEHQKNQ